MIRLQAALTIHKKRLCLSPASKYSLLPTGCEARQTVILVVTSEPSGS